jgi:hypothetical protein
MPKMLKTNISTAPKQPEQSAIRSLSVEEINAVSGANASATLLNACLTGKHIKVAKLTC